MKPPDLRLKRSDFPGVDWIDKLLRPLMLFAAQTQSAMTKGLTFKENITSEEIEVTVQMQDAWHDVTLASPWAAVPGRSDKDYQPPKWRKFDNGMVLLSGSFAKGSAGSKVFTLPEEAWPKKEVNEIVWADFDNVPSAYRLHIDQYGVVTVGEGSGGVCESAYLNTYFEAADLTPDINGAFPISQKLSVVATPSAVLPTKVVESPTPLDERPAQKAISVDWSMQNNLFVIHDIPGLQPGKKYKVTLLVLGG